MNKTDEEMAQGTTPVKREGNMKCDKAANTKDLKRKGNLWLLAVVVSLAAVGILTGTLVNKRNRDHSRNDLVNPDSNQDREDDSSDEEIWNETTPEVEIQYFEYEEAPVPFKIPLYSPDHIGVYSNESEALSAFENFGSFLVSNIALGNLGYRGFNAGGFTRDMGMGGAMFAEAAPARGVDGGSSGQVGSTADAFETNNQEDSVDQADVAKSDGKFIFAAFSDYLLVFRAGTEDLVLRLPMPEIKQEDDCSDAIVPYPEVEPIDMVIVDEGAATGDGTTKAEAEFEEAEADNVGETEDADLDVDVAADEPALISVPRCHYRPRPYIESLLLSEGRLAVVVSGHGYTHRQSKTDQPVLWDYLATHLRVYDTTDLDNGELPLLGVKDINGYYNEAFVVGDVAHVVTMSGINTHDWLVAPAQRFNADDDDFVQRLREDAEDNFIPRFATALAEDLSVSTGSLPKISRFSMMVDGVSGVPGFENALLRDGVVNSMAQITSFNMDEADSDSIPDTSTNGEPSLDVSITCQFLSSYWSQVYATGDMIILAGQGSRFVPSLEASEQATFLFGFGLDGVETTPDISGVVPGSLLSPYSIDYFDGHLRIATTIRNRVFVDTFLAEPRPMTRPVRTDDSEVVAVSTTSNTDRVGSEREDGGLVGSVEIVSECPEIDDECILEDTFLQCQELFDDGCSEVFYSPSSGCPHEFYCLDRYDTIQCPLPTDPCMTLDGFLECNRLVNDGCTNVGILESFPCQFQCEDDIPDVIVRPVPPVVVDTTTENQIYVLTREESSNQLEIIGNATMGKPNECKFSRLFFATTDDVRQRNNTVPLTTFCLGSSCPLLLMLMLMLLFLSCRVHGRPILRSHCLRCHISADGSILCHRLQKRRKTSRPGRTQCHRFLKIPSSHQHC